MSSEKIQEGGNSLLRTNMYNISFIVKQYVGYLIRPSLALPPLPDTHEEKARCLKLAHMCIDCAAHNHLCKKSLFDDWIKKWFNWQLGGEGLMRENSWIFSKREGKYGRQTNFFLILGGRGGSFQHYWPHQNLGWYSEATFYFWFFWILHLVLCLDGKKLYDFAFS